MSRSLRPRLASMRQRMAADKVGQERIERLSFAVGALHAREARRADGIHDAEFRCFSQFGEDGIIQWLLAHVPMENEVFLERMLAFLNKHLKG